MSELRDRVQSATREAMKARDKARVGVLRLISAEVQRVEVDERRELDDPDVLRVIDKMLKQRKDSEQQYRDAGRQDLADQEAYEVSVLIEFLPQPLSDAELNGLIDAALSESGATSPRDMGKVMTLLRPQVQGRADMAAVSQLVKARLTD